MLAQLWSYFGELAPSGSSPVKVASHRRQRNWRSLKTVAVSGLWPTTLTVVLDGAS